MTWVGRALAGVAERKLVETWGTDHMDIRQLRYFLVIAETGSLSAAARTIGIAQPSLSQYIIKLEAELGIQLLHRSPLGVSLTEAGQFLVERGGPIVTATETLVADLSNLARTVRGAVRFGVPSSVSMVLSVPLAETIRIEFPEIRFRAMDAMSGYIERWLPEGSIDLGMLYDIHNPRLNALPILTEELYLVTAPDCWPDPAGPGGVAQVPITFRNCQNLELILPSPSHGLRTLIDRCAREHQLTFNIAVEMDSLNPIKDLVLRGSGFSILPQTAVQREVARGDLMLVPIQDPALRRTIYLANNPLHTSSRATAEVARLAVDVSAELVRNSLWLGRLSEEVTGYR